MPIRIHPIPNFHHLKLLHLCRKPVQGLDAAADTFRPAGIADAFQEIEPFADDRIDLPPYLFIVQLCFPVHTGVQKEVQENKKAGKNCQAQQQKD